LAWYQLGKKVSGVLIFFPPPDRAHSSIDPTKGFLPASSLINACCLLLPAATGRILFFPFLSPHGEAHRSSHLFTIPVPG